MKNKLVEAQYERDCQAMLAAARKFLLLNPGARVAFNRIPDKYLKQVPQGVPVDKLEVIAVLSDTYDWWPANPETRALLEALEKASRGQATYLMAKVIIDMALEERGMPSSS